MTFWDDFPFVLSVLRDVERVGVTETPYYHFIRARAESETSRWREGMYEKREDEHTWMLDLYRHWGVDDERSMEVVYRRYAERLIGCIENATCADSKLTRAEQRAAVKRMVETPQAKLAVDRTVPHSLMMRVMLWPIKADHPWVAYMEGRFISFVKRHFDQDLLEAQGEPLAVPSVPPPGAATAPTPPRAAETGLPSGAPSAE